ncbi:MAG: TrkH family potassium uptake protein, partial [Lachnospiraceae bacterium]|nr:TrkH family potassium uptake protein [Lachnospiraceae bacterium]
VAVCYREKEGIAFLLVGSVAIFLGFLAVRKKPENVVFYLKEGCVTTALSWIVLSVCGCIPFILTSEIPSFTNALFETVSGFTTTGASILSDVEALSHASLFWRSFTHWIGGMGVLVFLLAVIPMSGGSNINLMRAESPGPSVGKLVPKIRYTARILYQIYFLLTITEIIFLLLGRMPLFDAVCTAFGTAGTGGFGIRNTSLAGYSMYLQWVTTVFMILFGVNFNAYYLLLMREFKKAGGMEEVRTYLGIIFAAIVIIFLDTIHLAPSPGRALTDAAFQVGSIITTTGFSTADFDMWPMLSKSILVVLMFIGACAGSTGGGLKVSRILIAFKTMLKEFGSYIHPKSVKIIKMDDKPIDHDVLRSTNVYFITFVMIFTCSMLLVSVEEVDFTTCFTAVAATFNNIGPGLSLVGPSCNFSFFSPFTKWVLMFDMLAGRLELFPLLILFAPSLWKEITARKPAKKDV